MISDLSILRRHPLDEVDSRLVGQLGELVEYRLELTDGGVPPQLTEVLQHDGGRRALF